MPAAGFSSRSAVSRSSSPQPWFPDGDKAEATPAVLTAIVAV
jgi:hypothetical protein